MATKSQAILAIICYCVETTGGHLHEGETALAVQRLGFLELPSHASVVGSFTSASSGRRGMPFLYKSSQALDASVALSRRHAFTSFDTMDLTPINSSAYPRTAHGGYHWSPPEGHIAHAPGHHRYKLGKRLGSGTFAMVVAGKDLDSEAKPVVVKVIFHDSIAKPEAIRNEVAIQRKVHLPTPNQYAIQLYDYFELGVAGKRDRFMVLESAPYGTLFDLIVKNKRLAEPRAKHIFHQLVNGVHLLHARGVTHRDLKCENVLLMNPEEDVKICDFGLAADMDDGREVQESRARGHRSSHLLTACCGSPNYAAPEVFGKPAQYDGPPADVWSLGVILYAMLQGYLAYEEKSNDLLVHKIRMGDFKPYKQRISSEADDLMNRIFTVEPDRRITLAQIASHPWMQ